MSIQRTDSRTTAEAGSKHRAVERIDQRLLKLMFLLRERGWYPARAGHQAPWRLIRSVGNIAPYSGAIFQTSIGKDDLT